MNKEKILIFGASTLGKIALESLSDKYDVIYFADNDTKKDGSRFCDIEIINPKNIKYIKYDKIVVASQFAPEIVRQLLDFRLKKIYVFYYKIDYITREELGYISKYRKLDLSDYQPSDFLEYLKTTKPEKENNFDISYRDKNVLFIAPYFPPTGGSGVQRSLKFVKYLRDFGWNPIVITRASSYGILETDYTMANELEQDISIIALEQSILNQTEITLEESQKLLDMIFYLIDDIDLSSKLLANIQDGDIRYLIEPDNHILWALSALEQIKNIIDFTKIDAIYTTSGPHSAHMLGYYLKLLYNKPWVADFRDEWSYNPYNEYLYRNDHLKLDIHRDIEKTIIAQIDNLISVSPNARKSFIRNFNLPETIVTTITNGYDEHDFNQIKNCSSSKKFILAFNGIIYYNRNLTPIIEQINLLISKNKINKKLVEVIIIGRAMPEIKIKMDLIDNYNVIKYVSYLEHIESLIKVNMANALILYIGEEDKYKSVYSGKVFEYLRLKKPIIAISPPNSEVEELLNYTNSGRNFNHTNYDELSDYIYELYNIWQRDGEIKLDSKNIELYERKRLTGELANLLTNSVFQEKSK